MKSGISASPKNIIGLMLIVLGAAILLERAEIISGEVTGLIFSIPALLMLVGAIIYLNSSNKLLGSIVFLIGALIMTGRIFPDLNIDFNLLLPVIIIIIGIYLVMKNKKTVAASARLGNVMSRSDSKNIIDEIAIFGGGEKAIHSDNFRGGKITNIFGGSEIDLTDCRLPADSQEIEIEIVAIFGGCELIVPRDWKIQVDGVQLFGGFSNKLRKRDEDIVLTPQTVFIRGVAIFGGAEIRTR
ncbi:MAG: hypothetical protein IT279_12200 [Ignavibacteriaceae bacterium]|nr:hypothetical protein [Ignavibacteriaceae bacterium]